MIPSYRKRSRFADNVIGRTCRQFLATFLPGLVDEADYAAEFLLLYRHDEDGKPTAAASNANAETVGLHGAVCRSTALSIRPRVACVAAQAGRTVHFGVARSEGGTAPDEEDTLMLDDPEAHQNNQRLSTTRRIGIAGMRMLSALMEGIEADFFSLVRISQAGCIPSALA